MPDRPDELKPGDAFGYRDKDRVPRVGERSAAWLNQAAGIIRSGSPGIPGLPGSRLDSGDRRHPIMARLSGSTSPYSWVEVYPDPDSTAWLDHPASRGGTANAYEVNGVAGLDGKVALLRHGFGGRDWRFVYTFASGGGGPIPDVECEGLGCNPVPETLSVRWTQPGGDEDHTVEVVYTVPNPMDQIGMDACYAPLGAHISEPFPISMTLPPSTVLTHARIRVCCAETPDNRIGHVTVWGYTSEANALAFIGVHAVAGSNAIVPESCDPYYYLYDDTFNVFEITEPL